MIVATGFIALLSMMTPVWAHTPPGPALPAVSLGVNPHKSVFGEFVDEGGLRDVLVIPEGQDFIITAFRETGGDLELLRDDEVILLNPPYYREYVAAGNAKLRVAGGATIRVRRLGSWVRSPYYLQGYFVAAGSPHRFVSAHTPGGGTHTIWASDPDRDFLVRTLFTTTSWCEVSLDGVPISSSGFPFDTMANNSLGQGRGMLVVRAGSSLSLTHGMEGEPCTYLIEGQYLQP
jgi:hypothetical protein